jgi:hypothetical protein
MLTFPFSHAPITSLAKFVGWRLPRGSRSRREPQLARRKCYRDLAADEVIE